MSKPRVPLEDVLFVFGQWTLMMNSSFCPEAVKAGDVLFLFDGSGESVGSATVEKLMPSRNPEITPLQVVLHDNILNMKSIKYFER